MPTDLGDAVFTVIDTETTGLDARSDRIVEFAFVRVSAGQIVERFATLIDPERPIPAGASAVHGIVDADVSGAPVLERVMPRIVEACADAVVVAHNAAFDLRFLPALSARPALCTLRLAKHFVDAPNYRNAFLADYLGLRGPAGAEREHRALGDATMTARLLLALLERFRASGTVPTLEALLALAALTPRMSRLFFGRYRGQPVADVPSSYLRWMLRVDFWDEARHTAEAELARRAQRYRNLTSGRKINAAARAV